MIRVEIGCPNMAQIIHYFISSFFFMIQRDEICLESAQKKWYDHQFRIIIESPLVFLENSARSKETLLSGQTTSGKKLQIWT